MNPAEFCFECPACGQHISATYDAVGITANCPACSTSFTVPAPQPAAPAPKRVSKQPPDVLPGAGVQVPKEGSAQVQQPGAKARKMFRAILEFLDRSLTRASVVSITVLLLIGSWAYPPGYHTTKHSHGRFFLFDMSSEMRVDFGRLILLDAIIAAIGLLFARIINRRERTRSIAVRVVFYSLVAAPIIAIVWSIVAHIGYVRYQATEERARRETERVRHERQEMLSKGVADNLSSPARASDVLATILWFRSDGYTDNEISWALAQRFNGFLEIQELGPKIGYETPKQGDTLSSLERALLADSLRVNDVDLEKLTLTEIAPSVSGETLYGFHGRIRNDLTRAVHSIRAKASIYDSGGKLAEVLTFWLNRSLNSENDFAKAVPGEPASFETRVRVEHMPKGFTYKVQVIEGHYIQ